MIKPCLRFEPLVEALLADELDHADRERLLQHAMTCAECRSYVDLHHELLDVDTDDGLPSPVAFAAMRERVVRLGRTTSPAARAMPGPWQRVAPWRGLAAAAAAAMFLAAGFVAGWGGRALRGSVAVIDLAAADLPSLENADGRLLQPVGLDGGGLEALGRSPYQYSNVTVDETDDGRLDLKFDVSRRMTLRGSPDDPLVRNVLLSTLLDPSPLGARLQAATYAARSLDPVVRDALLAALTSDPSRAVRGRCLELLQPVADDPDVQQALVAVLRGDDAVNLRLQAIDLLAASAAGRARLDRAMEGLDGPDDRALVVRATHRLR